MTISKSERKLGAYILQDQEILAYAARNWTMPPTMKDFEVLKSHLDKLFLDGKLGFSARAFTRAKDISDVWKKTIDTAAHCDKVGEMTAVAKFVLEAAGVPTPPPPSAQRLAISWCGRAKFCFE